MNFPEIIPETIVTASSLVLSDFLKRCDYTVIKPINDCSGRGIFMLSANDPNKNYIIDQVTQYGTKQVIAQQFLPDISHGDKRVLLLGGEILGCIQRNPQKGDFRSNVNAGGYCTLFELNQTERDICSIVGQWLKQQHIHLAGIDIVGDYLLEVNITSPSCMREMNDLAGLHLEKEVLDYVEGLSNPGNEFEVGTYSQMNDGNRFNTNLVGDGLFSA